MEIEKLTTGEYATLRGCSEQYVRKLIKDKKIHVEEHFGALGGGKGGISYLIPLAGIEPHLIKKWRRKHPKKNDSLEESQLEEELDTIWTGRTIEDLTLDERKEITHWKQILEGWKNFRSSYRKKTDADEAYIQFLQATYPDEQFSVRILYRKEHDFRKYGEFGLLDKRGKHGNHNKAIPNEVWDIFEYFYLDESRKEVKLCMDLTEEELRRIGKADKYLPLASSSTFCRYVIDKIPVPMKEYFRFGKKAFRDKCAPYIRRIYDNLWSNDIWVCDNHTFDVMVDGGESDKPIRVYITGFLDVRSRKMVGWYVTNAPCSDATLMALRRGIERYGIPKLIYSDNGREFLTHDIGGHGFRKTSTVVQNEHNIPTILDNLGIEFHTAMVKNARAKIIERAFRDVKNLFSRLFEGYTGGTILERPERLKELEKDVSNFTALEDFREYVDKFIIGIFNKTHSKGAGMNGRTRDEVFAKCLIEQRVATPEELNLMMLRNSRMQKVQRAGLKLRMYDTDLYFVSHELLLNHIGEKVYFRYNPDDLAEVRVYDEKDRFLCTAHQDEATNYFVKDKETLQEKMREQRKFEKVVSSYKKQKGIETASELELIMAKAERQMADGEYLDPKVIVPMRKIDEVVDDDDIDIYDAVGSDLIDYTVAIERFKALQQNKEGE